MSFATDITLRQPDAGLGPIIAALDGDVLTYIAATQKWGGRALPTAPTPWANLIWVNAAALVAGDGSEGFPFQTFTEAVAAAPVGEGTAIMVGPGDYSLEPQVSIADQFIAVLGLGGAETAGAVASPPARPVLPDIAFDVSLDPLVFYAERCELGTCEVNTPISATLEDCSSVWDDAGGDAAIRSSSSPTPFGGPPEQSIAGTCGNATLQGMAITAGLNAAGSIVCYDCLSTSGGGGLVAANSIVCKNGEYGAAATLTAPNIFLDQWSWFQVQEHACVLSTEPNVQELSPVVWMWGANNANNNEFLNPNILFGTTAATAATDYHSTPRRELGASIHVQIAAAHGADITCTLYVGATIAGVAATALTVTLPAGQLRAVFDLVPPVNIPDGSFKAVLFSSGANVAANSLECLVTCN